jgi:4-oxalocrotonate tautomerase
MPLVRISLTANRGPAYAEALSQGVHEALVATFNVPADDYFQIVTEHESGMKITPSFLGVSHGSDPVFVQIACSPGRSLDQKKALYARIVDNLAAAPGVPREDVIINLLETVRDNWSFGCGIAQYAA